MPEALLHAASARRWLSRIGCVILAGGEGRRFGGHAAKLVAPVGAKPLVAHAIDAVCASRALTCTLVLGCGHELVLCAVDSRRCCVVFNPGWREGIASSLRAGLAHHLSDDACIFVVADQPHVTTGDIDNLIAAAALAPDNIATLHAGGVWGSPMLFPRADFAELMKLTGDAGAKSHALGQQQRITLVEAQHSDAFLDIDTREDAARLSGGS
ncbi:MAG: nucleotidyltransferase family protein [Candidatus Eremiobacteraeota bacterium]|nr:nucleotidyltransferase family protein [Candidatus Eremiobacteraeota bacterium]